MVGRDVAAEDHGLVALRLGRRGVEREQRVHALVHGAALRAQRAHEPRAVGVDDTGAAGHQVVAVRVGLHRLHEREAELVRQAVEEVCPPVGVPRSGHVPDEDHRVPGVDRVGDRDDADVVRPRLRSCRQHGRQ